MKAIKNLVIISPGFPADENDSTCLPSQQLFVKAINKTFPDINVCIVSLQYPYHTNQYQWHENLVIPLHGKRFARLFRPLLWLRANALLKKLDTNSPIDGILCLWCQETALIGKRFAERKQIPYKIWICGQDARANNRLVRWINPKPTDLMAMSDFLADEFEKNHRIRPVHIVPNGIDPGLVPAHASERDIDILGVGSLIPLKQYSIFIDVVYELTKSNGSLKAVLAGDGVEKDKILAKVQALRLQNNIELVGTLSHQEVLKLTTRAKVFLHPSAYEGFSTACLEALNGGCRVISFTKPMKEEIPNWRAVDGLKEMVTTAKEILHQPQVYSPMTYSHIKDSAVKIISLLFGRP